MARQFQTGSLGFPDPSSSSGSSAPSRSRRIPPTTYPSSSNFYTHPSRTSLLSPDGSDPGTGGSAGNGGSAQEGPLDPDGSTSEAAPRPWRGGLPSFSRAFNMLMAAQAADGSRGSEEDTFFVPSYLEGSKYVQKLEEAHRSNLQARDANRSSANGASPNLTALYSHQNPLPSGSHRGMSHTVIERPPAFEEDDTLPPLPSKWNKDDQWPAIEIQSDGLSLKYVGPKNQNDRDHEACAVRADHYMPRQCGVYYFEVHILSAKRDDATIGIGFSTKSATLSRPVGWEPEAWGYHGDDGRCFTGQNIGRPFGPLYNTGDVVGCGVNFRDNTAFFTRNGTFLGSAFHDVQRGKLYPAISLKKPGEHIRVNFGQSPFVYNINDLMRVERANVQSAIRATDTSTLVKGMSETDLIQALVLQFLQNDGYVETARAFADDMRVQKEALNLDPNIKTAGVNIRDDEDANNRQRIRRAILEGDIDRALKYTNAYYPTVLQDNEHVYFRLRCRRFIEMVRRAAQMNSTKSAKSSNGHGAAAAHDMDLDMNGDDSTAWPGAVDTDGVDAPLDLAELERDMLEYGQSLQAEYANDPRKEVSKALNEIWALVAYPNPLKEPQVSHLLDRQGRVAVAEELNSAILLSLGKSSRAALEKLYAQTSVLLDDLRQDGGEGAFVSVDDALDDVPRPAQL